VYAIELDPILVHYLRERFRDEPKLTVVPGDVLHTRLDQWGRVTVAGNLPYYITSPITERVLALGPLLLAAVFLVQKEVAERMAARPGSRDYGYFSVLCQLLSEVELLFTVPPGAFRPPPKVDSAVVRLRPRPNPLLPATGAFLQFAGAAFRHKRKNLRNNLSALFPKELVDAQPEANLRAEQLTVEQLIELYQRLSVY
jgi:16S rRNA (adenine1518-N6/adenine1519-N6)-dimethyltransferase